MTPSEKYHKDLQHSDFYEDPSQKHAIMLLDDLYHRLVHRVNTPTEKHPLWQKMFRKKTKRIQPERGIYLWGGVGRGKTYLVDTFFECLPFEKKIRLHFHRFMQRIHLELQALPGEIDPLKKVAGKLADESHIICFDEFFVSDITDAMILGRLMEALFERGICLVVTSNIVPENLYLNGLQRIQFLPTIALLNKHCEVENVDGGTDYRLRTLEQAEIYHYPLDMKAKTNLELYFCKLAMAPYIEDHVIKINNRLLKTIREVEGVIHFDFSTLCDAPRSQWDYIEIARLYHTVFLSNVLKMGICKDAVAKRFIAMVDEFYERNVKLIISAEVTLEDLYLDGRLSFDFKRCCSRLKEMQSYSYLALKHLP
ncbi:cell division protein ZapE [Candidatus Enterovibrio escicola]|uniref:cell division protein ZapE n=1 Tax=Candidatus Enterovibrio escicola TaxID=1927127 RepID=UPI001238257A|nr:cell division protein ZapE [Candidatus Enterovibrio escacola]